MTSAAKDDRPRPDRSEMAAAALQVPTLQESASLRTLSQSSQPGHRYRSSRHPGREARLTKDAPFHPLLF